MFSVPVGLLAKLFFFVWYKLRYSEFKLVLASIVLGSNMGIFLSAVVAIFFMFFERLGSFGLILVGLLVLSNA